MLGDLGVGGFFNVQSRRGATSTARIPLASRSSFKISENESPRPVDRFFLTYNYYNDLRGLTTTDNGSVVTPRFDVHREIVGFEKTFLDQNASIGMRLPIFEETGDGNPNINNIGDLSVVFKYAFVNDRSTGNVWSAGMVVTAPTGPNFLVIEGQSVHPVILQPFTGYIVNLDRWYVQGFFSVAVPTDERDVTLMENDLGVGYRLLERHHGEAALNYLIPTLEAHVTTPLNHRGINSVPIGFPDIVDLTTGVHMGLFDRSDLALGVATPLTGPKPYSVEALVYFNWRF
jgi:hypothetical protein